MVVLWFGLSHRCYRLTNVSFSRSNGERCYRYRADIDKLARVSSSLLRLSVPTCVEDGAQMSLCCYQLLALPCFLAGVFWSAEPVSGAPGDAGDVAQ